MSRWLREGGAKRRTIGVDSRGAAWLDPASRQLRTAEGPTALAAALEATQGRDLVITVANDLAVHWVQQVPRAVGSLAELRQVAEARCAHLFGHAPSDWAVAGDWRARGSFVCAAWPRSLVRQVEQAAASGGLRVRWSTGWSAACGALRSAIPNGVWNALRGPSTVVAWRVDDGAVTGVVRMGAAPDEAAASVTARVEQALAVQAVREPALASGTVRWHAMPQPPEPALEAAHALAWALSEGAWA